MYNIISVAAKWDIVHCFLCISVKKKTQQLFFIHMYIHTYKDVKPIYKKTPYLHRHTMKFRTGASLYSLSISDAY